MSGAHPGRKREPGKRFEFVIEKESCEAAGGALTAGDRRSTAAVVEDCAEKFVILLIEGVDSRLKVVSRNVETEARLSPGVVGCAMVGRCYRCVIGHAVVVGLVVVVERRNRH